MSDVRSSIRDLGSVFQPSMIASRHSLAWRIRVRFSGGLPPHEYLTPDIRRKNPGWGDEVFNRQIERLDFFLPTGHRIVLSGMEAYNFFLEASDSFSRWFSARIEALWLCGKLPRDDTIEMWRVGQGRVLRKRGTFGLEWGGAPTSGWKLGHMGDRVISTIMEGHNV